MKERPRCRCGSELDPNLATCPECGFDLQGDFGGYHRRGKLLRRLFARAETWRLDLFIKGLEIGARVLECGAGGGTYMALLKGEREDVRLTGIEILTSACLEASRYCDSRGTPAEVVLGDSMRTPFRDASFDMTYGIGFIEHFRDPGNILKERLRVTKGGGTMLDLVPNYSFPRGAIRRLENRVVHGFRGYERPYDRGSLLELYSRAGLEDIEIKGVQLLLPYPLNAPLRAIELRDTGVNFYLCRHLVVRGVVG